MKTTHTDRREIVKKYHNSEKGRQRLREAKKRYYEKNKIIICQKIKDKKKSNI